MRLADHPPPPGCRRRETPGLRARQGARQLASVGAPLRHACVQAFVVQVRARLTAPLHDPG